MKNILLTFLFLSFVTISCTKDYVCVCEAPAEDTVLTLTTDYPGLRKGEAEIEQESCEERSICRWEESK